MYKAKQGENPFKTFVDELNLAFSNPMLIMTSGADIKNGAVRFLNSFHSYFEIGNTEDDAYLATIAIGILECLEENTSAIKKRDVAGYTKKPYKFLYCPLNGKLKKLMLNHLEEYGTSEDAIAIKYDIEEGADGIIFNKNLLDQYD